MTSLSPFLRDNLKVTPADNEQIEVTVSLPADVLPHYVRLLESLSGFFQFVTRQAKYAQIKSDVASQKYAEEAQ